MMIVVKCGRKYNGMAANRLGLLFGNVIKRDNYF
jgi:hypothetical protein